MYRTGHYGAALLTYAPVGFLLVAAGYEKLAIIGGGIVLGGSMVPDWDQLVPFISHRGITHTFWFALLVGLLLGAGGWVIGSEFGAQVQGPLGVFGFVIGTVMIGAHLFADALTPMGIRPFAPLGSGSCTVGLTRAANPIGNGLLLVLGVLVAGGALAAGREFSLAML
ncbi:metal-dependent hydrolase [Halodesulfurarchaeum sp.]|uniref:metal-dependent hydrolase n=1 Tax=Halodesulfurarchaeum sp. TaxID=1980530 RepID=UPI002FC38FAE